MLNGTVAPYDESRCQFKAWQRIGKPAASFSFVISKWGKDTMGQTGRTSKWEWLIENEREAGGGGGKCPCSNSSSFRPATAWCRRVWITPQIASRVCCCLLSIRAIRQWHHKTHQQLQVSEKTSWREGLRLLIDTFSSSLYCQGRHAQLLSYSLNFSHMPPRPFKFLSFFPLSIYSSKPSSISISSRAKLKWAEECWEKVGSHIWNHQGKTCQSFWCGARLWLWEWAVTISGAGKVLSHQGKALKTVRDRVYWIWYWNVLSIDRPVLHPYGHWK